MKLDIDVEFNVLQWIIYFLCGQKNEPAFNRIQFQFNMSWRAYLW